MSDLRATVVFFILFVVCSLFGCGSALTFEFDTLDSLPPEDELTELSLGKFRIPIPVAEQRQSQFAYRHRMLFDFELHALVTPAEKSRVADTLSQHEGKIRDYVIRVCRNATAEELQEPDLNTIKARLINGLAAQIGEKQLRHLLITGIVSQQL
jgi:hypothetical protein